MSRPSNRKAEGDLTQDESHVKELGLAEAYAGLSQLLLWPRQNEAGCVGSLDPNKTEVKGAF